MKPATHLALACGALVLASGFCAFEIRRGPSTQSASLPVRSLAPKVARTDPALVPKAEAPAQPLTGPAELPLRARQIIDHAPRGPDGVPMVRPEALFADLPALKLTFSKAAEAQQRLGYAQFIRTIGLSPDEESQFIRILSNRETRWGEIRATATAQGLGLSSPFVSELDAGNFAETEANLRGLLGPDRYDQLQKYRETLDSRLGLLCLSALVSTSYSTDHPLTLAQMNQLATITTETGVLSYEKALTMPDGPAFDRALVEAEKILTPAQMEVFGLLVDQRQISFTMTKIARDRKK